MAKALPNRIYGRFGFHPLIINWLEFIEAELVVFVEVIESGNGHTKKSHSRGDIKSGKELARHRPDTAGSIGGFGQRVRTCHLREIGVFDFQRDGSSSDCLVDHARCGGVNKPCECHTQLCLGREVMHKGLFVANRFRFDVGNNGAIINTQGQVVQSAARGMPQSVTQRRNRQFCKLADRLHAQVGEVTLGDRAHTPEFTHAERSKKCSRRRFGHDNHPQTFLRRFMAAWNRWFCMFGRDLRDELGRGNPHATRQTNLPTNGITHFVCNVSAGAYAMQRAGDITKRFIKRQGFNQGRERRQNLHDLGADRRVAPVIPLDEHRLRAEFAGLHARHCRIHAKGACFIRRRRNNPTRAITPDHHRKAAQRRIVESLNRHEKRVHVDVQNGALAWQRHATSVPDTPTDRVSGMSEVPSAVAPPIARVLAFVAILFAGLLGGMIGWALVNLQYTGDASYPEGLGALVGAVICATGVAVVVTLVMRAMNEWRTIQHGVNPRTGAALRQSAAAETPQGRC